MHLMITILNFEQSTPFKFYNKKCLTFDSMVEQYLKSNKNILPFHDCIIPTIFLSFIS